MKQLTNKTLKPVVAEFKPNLALEKEMLIFVAVVMGLLLVAGICFRYFPGVLHFLKLDDWLGIYELLLLRP